MGLLAFLVGVAYVPALPSNATVGRWIVLGLIVSILLYRVRLRPGPGHWLAAALGVWMLAGFAWAVSLWDHAGAAVQWLVLGMVFVVAAERPDLTSWWRGLCAGITVSTAFALAQAAGFNPVWTVYDGGYVGLFLSKNMAAEISTLALVGAIGLAWRDLRSNWWLLPGPAVAVYMVGSRVAVLALLVAAMTRAWLAIDRADRPIAGLVLVTGGALVAVLILVFAPGLLSMNGSWLYVTDRWLIWRHVVPLITLWGDGLGSFQIAMTTVEFAHNELIQYGFELGVGVFLLVGIFVYAFGGSDVIERCALAALVAQCMVWFPLHAPATAMVFATLAGALCGARNPAWVSQPDGRARCL